jgi:electron transport complex protein RnfE
MREGAFFRGLARENPLLVYLLGLCPALAVSDLVSKALGLGAGVILVLLAAVAAARLLRPVIPERLQPIVWLVLVAALVSLVDLAMQAWLPALRQQLGVYLQLLAVNCLILGLVERLARSRSLSRCLQLAAGQGAGFTLALLLIALVREVLGSGTITLFPFGSFGGVIRIPGLSLHPARAVSLAAGALLVLGYLVALAGRLKAGGRRAEQRSAG